MLKIGEWKLERIFTHASTPSEAVALLGTRSLRMVSDRLASREVAMQVIPDTEPCVPGVLRVRQMRVLTHLEDGRMVSVRGALYPGRGPTVAGLAARAARAAAMELQNRT